MKSWLLSIMISLGILALGVFSAPAQERTPEEVRKLLESKPPAELQFVPGEVIVKMKPTLGLKAAEALQMGIQAVQTTSGGEIIYRLLPSIRRTLPTGQARDRTLAVIRELSERPDVAYAQPNYIIRIADTIPNDPRYPEQWHYFNNGAGTGESPGGISLPRAWDTTTGTTSAVVAVIDTGILPNHPDIMGSPNLIAGFDMISDAGRANDGDGRDSDPTDPGDAASAGECFPGSPALPNSWHGTHVAGTIGVGRTNNGVGVAGINWNVRLQAVRVLGKCGGTIADINDGIRWAAGLPVPGVPTNPTPAKVINMSLGGGGACSLSPSTQVAINDAVGSGAAVVVAAGNEASDASGFIPASCDNVITVAASDFRGHLVTRYSNFGATVEIMAPGGDVLRDDDGDGNNDGVLSMVHPADGTFARYNGTSMAAPHVAGVAALWLAQDPGLTPVQLLAELQKNASPRTSSQCPQPCGAGLLSAVRGDRLMVTLVLDPNRTLDPGETATATATVTMAGSPETGKTVMFSTADPRVASVSPAAAVTDADGRARTTVRGESSGNTTVAAAVNGTSASAPVEVASVQVPDLSLIGVIFLVVCMLLFGLRRKQPTSVQQ